MWCEEFVWWVCVCVGYWLDIDCVVVGLCGWVGLFVVDWLWRLVGVGLCGNYLLGVGLVVGWFVGGGDRFV